MERKNILLLSTIDERGEGHAWSYIKDFEKLGCNVDFISLLRTHKETKKFIINTLNPFSLKYILYKLYYLIIKIVFAPFPNIRGTYKGFDFSCSKDIIKRLSFKPDYIIIGSYQTFLSPKSIWELWKETNAQIVLLMVDNKPLAGGCAYPGRCSGYKSGCKDCYMYKYLKVIPRYIYNQKEKYFSQIPFHLVGTTSDLEKATNVNFLDHCIRHVAVGTPSIPFKLSKYEARMKLGLNENDFIIMTGAANVSNPNKGYREMCESLKKFSSYIDSKNVSMIVLGNNIPKSDFPSNINVVTPGYLNLEGLFSHYYACDLYLSPSIEDSGPYMVNYAIACGRPVVAFKIGVAIDLIKYKETGYIADLIDIEQYAAGINYFYSLESKDFETIEKNCLDVLETYRITPWYKLIE